MPLLPELVKLEPVAHKYFSSAGEEYLSVSKIYGSVKSVQDFEMIAYFSARKELRVEYRTDVTGIEPDQKNILLRKKILLAKWGANSKNSTDEGTYVHGLAETRAKHWILTGGIHYDQAIEDVYQKYLSEYNEFYVEEVLYSQYFLAAGTADFLGVRCIQDRKKVIDIVDYKTNSSKGIEYRSQYKNRMLAPVSHLECCSYNHYCLQQSVYARFLEEHGFTIGQIRLISIPPYNEEKFQASGGVLGNPMNHFPIPVPYMKREAEAILLHLNQKGILRGRNRQTIRL